MDAIWEKARDVGRLLAQTDEYSALVRANRMLADDRETITALNRLGELQEQFARGFQMGSEPSEEDREEFERLSEEVQVRPAYQAAASAQANFDRLMMRVNEEIGRGLEAGEQSRIILPS